MLPNTGSTAYALAPVSSFLNLASNACVFRVITTDVEDRLFKGPFSSPTAPRTPEFDTKRCKYLIYIDRVRELPLQEA